MNVSCHERESLPCCCVDSTTQKNFKIGMVSTGLNNYIYEGKEQR